MKVEYIIRDWLKERGYDGLVNVKIECGCCLDDLIPCCSYFGECEPGYKHEDGFMYKAKIGNGCYCYFDLDE